MKINSIIWAESGREKGGVVQMDMLLNALAKLFETAANSASESTSLLVLYQPKKPECLCKKKSDKK